MNLRSLLPVFAAVGLLGGADSRLLEIRQVYVLPMGGGLDQYLANRLTHNGRYVVVTDPAKADALLTDTIGITFEEKYKELYPPPAPPTPPEGSKDAKKDDKSMIAMLNAGGMPTRTTAFSRGKGNVFLVDRASRSVVWSVYMPPRNRTASEMNRTADRIVDKMDDAVEKYEKSLKKSAAMTAAPPRPATPAPAAVAVPTPAPAPVAPAKPASPAPAPAK